LEHRELPKRHVDEQLTAEILWKTIVRTRSNLAVRVQIRIFFEHRVIVGFNVGTYNQNDFYHIVL
jgi:hypothetical protein